MTREERAFNSLFKKRKPSLAPALALTPVEQWRDYWIREWQKNPVGYVGFLYTPSNPFDFDRMKGFGLFLTWYDQQKRQMPA